MTSKRLPLGPKGLPLIGNAIQYLRNPLGFLSRCATEYGDVVRLRLGDGDTYLLSRPEHIEHVLRRRHPKFIKGRATRTVLGFIRHGLLMTEGGVWRHQRMLAQPAFHSQQVARYGPTMAQSAARMIEGWQAGQVRDIHADLMQVTLQIITKAVFGLDLESEEIGEIGTSFQAISTFSERHVGVPCFVRWIPTPLSFRGKRAISQLHQTVDRIIQRHKSGQDSGDFLSRLLAAQDDEGRPMTEDELHDQTTTLILAGHETTAIALAFTCHLLSQHPNVQAALTSELTGVLGERLPTIEDIPRLRYVEWVIKEAMRLYPPAWVVNREAIDEDEIGGYAVPKGTQLVASQWIVHRDRRWFDEPEAFRPERWANDLERRLPRCAYFPFGDGPRICIGNHFAMTEAILVLATILQRYKLLPVPGQTIRLQPAITLRPRSGIRVRLELRTRTGQTEKATVRSA